MQGIPFCARQTRLIQIAGRVMMPERVFLYRRSLRLLPSLIAAWSPAVDSTLQTCLQIYEQYRTEYWVMQSAGIDFAQRPYCWNPLRKFWKLTLISARDRLVCEHKLYPAASERYTLHTNYTTRGRCVRFQSRYNTVALSILALYNDENNLFLFSWRSQRQYRPSLNLLSIMF